ncbi:hypothetical protein J3Q64DRAFT_1810248 [Phycomyces blakesleeanus]|uniref:Uncharacterized protein n=1 Tax=Phycomyces blakesleeanus TaxID=4837 RepID=A0ABR3AVT4_PHYBL
MQKQSQVSEIDERIAKIEKLVGTSAGQGPEDMPSGLASTTLINSMAKLEQQITILAQPRQLEMVARRIKVLNSELDRLNELKSGRKENTSSLNFSLHPTSTTAGVQSATTSAEGQNKEAAGGLSNEAEEKVNHLFATMEKIDPLLNLTPALLTRLKALQGLHTEASTFGRSVKVISDEQSQMTQELKSLSATCDTV